MLLLIVKAHCKEGIDRVLPLDQHLVAEIVTSHSTKHSVQIM